VIMQYTGTGFEVFFRTGKEGLSSTNLIRFCPKNDYVREHGRDDMGGRTARQSFW